MTILVQNGTWNATTNVASDTGLAIPAVTSTPENPSPLQDGNLFNYYVVTTSDGAPHSYTNMETSQTYAVNDVIVSDPISNKWIKNLTNFTVQELGQKDKIPGSLKLIEATNEQPNIIIVGALPVGHIVYDYTNLAISNTKAKAFIASLSQFTK